jgi:hypothetical protein
MGDIYRVTIVRENSDGEQFESETVLEVAGGAQRVARAVTRELSDLFGETEPTPLPQRQLADVMFDAAISGQQVPAAVLAPNGHPFQNAEPVKRTRRTKAQIAADNAAQGLGYRDAAHRAEVEAQEAEVEDREAAAAVTEPTESAAGAVSPAAPESVPAEATPEAQPAEVPFNPFNVR